MQRGASCRVSFFPPPVLAMCGNLFVCPLIFEFHGCVINFQMHFLPQLISVPPQCCLQNTWIKALLNTGERQQARTHTRILIVSFNTFLLMDRTIRGYNQAAMMIYCVPPTGAPTESLQNIFFFFYSCCFELWTVCYWLSASVTNECTNEPPHFHKY